MPYLTTRKNLKLQLSPGLVASYNIQPGNGVGLFWDTTHTPDPHRVLSTVLEQYYTDGRNIRRKCNYMVFTETLYNSEQLTKTIHICK